MSSFQLILVRHGYSYGNQMHLLSGHSDVPLTESGRAELAALRRHCAYPQTQRYYSSDLQRCTETFQLLYEGRAVLDGLLPQLREMNFGSLENQSESEYAVSAFFRGWLQGERIADAETGPQFQNRIKTALTELLTTLVKEQITSATIVTHSGVIRALCLWLEQRPLQDFFQIEAPNGLGYILDLNVDKEQILLKQRRPLVPYEVTKTN